MPRWLQILIHLGAIAGGSWAAVATGSPIPLVVSGGINTAIGAVAQSFNPDGTPATQPFNK